MIALVAGLALAHRPGLSYARVSAEAVEVVFAEADAERVGAAALAAAVILSDGAPCAVGEVTSGPVEGDGVRFAAPLRCPAGHELTFAAVGLDVLPPGHRQYLESAGRSVAVLDAGTPRAAFSAGPASRGVVAAEFLKLGLEHIVTGFDHLAFLFGLLLAARGVREMALVVTGFTVAHSLTLALAVLDVVRIPSSIVEPAIALSIAFVALENFTEPPARRRLALTFGLGLLHGFGFAGILADLGLPPGDVALGLLAFNAGVELGQLAIVLPVLPVLLWLRRREAWRDRGVKVASSLLALLGAAWFLERVV